MSVSVCSEQQTPAQVTTLRIIHCFRSPVGGIFRHVRDLCEAQAAAGHEVGIVCDSTTGGEYEDKLFKSVEPFLALGVKRTPMQRHIGIGDIAAALRTYRLLRNLKPDVLHGHGAKGGVYSRLFGTLMRVSGSEVARLYSPHGGSLHYDAGTWTGRFFFGVERLMERVTDHLLFVSDYERRTFRSKIGDPRARNSLVYNGLQAREFEPVAPASDAVDFLYIGMMRDLKGPDIFIDALAETERQTDRNLTAYMIGNGDDLPKYKKQAKRLGFDERILFRPAMPAREAFALARIVVVPSRAEAMPYIVLEALAAGKPMIASAVGGIPEIFANHGRALVQPHAQELAARMVEALSDEQAFSEAMPSTAELGSRFGADGMARDIEAIYRSARS